MVIRIIGEIFDQFSQLNVGGRIYVKSSLCCRRGMTIQLIREERKGFGLGLRILWMTFHTSLGLFE